MVNSGIAPVTPAKTDLQVDQKFEPKLPSLTGLDSTDPDCKSCLNLCERYIISSQSGDPCITGLRCFSLCSSLLIRLLDHVRYFWSRAVKPPPPGRVIFF